jgi:exopolyphosphatase / guanosine-5'-triphosphate,3'-diphosphate pyrophosphatase
VAATRASAVRIVATSATRDAANAADFVTGVRAVLGVDPEVLSGDEEARLSFTGATTELAAAARPGVSGEGEGGGLAAAGPTAPPYLVADIGGGSTEFVLGDPPVVTGAVSVDIGCVRMTERHLRGDPPTPAEVAAARADIGAALDVVAAKIAVGDARTLVGLAGSVTTVAALALGLEAYDAGLIHHARIGVGAVQEQTARLLAMPQAERARLGVMHPGRVDVIGGGALVLEAIMTRFGFTEVLASEHDILDGIAWSLALGGSGARA